MPMLDRRRTNNALAASDAELVARVLTGDRNAFGALVGRYAASVRRVARAILGDPDDADDAVQDALLKALVKVRHYDPQQPFGPWLTRVVANTATDRRRRRTVRRALPLDDTLVAGGPAPDAITHRRGLGRRLQEALAHLPERRRLAVVLFDVEGYSHAEIGRILGLLEGTVRAEVFHARRALRPLLEAWKEEA
ncbi:MAG TPA: RNA polymerase sigma factor [Gemmatimonadales bacterium]|nr:RNA polymerase sigma factor [Gemmatimonadales bacterium]